MSVMNGFKVELLKSILGLSGHVTIQSQLGTLPNYDAVAARVHAVPGVVRATPIVDGQVMASQQRRQYRRDRARHPPRAIWPRPELVADKLRAGLARPISTATMW